MKTKKEVVKRLNAIKQARAEWLSIIPYSDARFPTAPINPDIFDINGTRAVTANILDLVLDLAEFVSDDQFLPEAYEIVLGVDRLLDAWGEWSFEIKNAKVGQYNYLSSPDAPKCWSVFDSVLQLIPERHYAIPESIETLNAQPGMRQNQIASIYGWVTESGEPDTNKVKEELQTPGRHYNPATWVSPEVSRNQAKFTKLWANREHRKKHISADQPNTNTKRQWADPGPAPEPIEQLLRMEGMTAHQVANMKQISLEEVYEAAHALGIALDHSSASELYPEYGDPINRFKPLSEIQQKIDTQLNSEVSDLKKGNKQRQSLPDRVIELLRDNPSLDAGTIHRVVNHRYPTATFEEIQRMVKTVSSIYSGMSEHDPIEDVPEATDEVNAEIEAMSRKQLLETADQLGMKSMKNRPTADLKKRIARQLASKA